MIRWLRVLAVLTGLSGIVACDSGSRPEMWIIPDGYVGWLRLDYSIAGAPSLPIENGRYIVRLPRSGMLVTSTANRPPIDKNQYTTDSPAGLRKLLRENRVNPDYAIQNAFSFGRGPLNADFPPPQAECVFVGTYQDFRQNGRDCLTWRLGESQPPKFPTRVRKP